MKRLRRFLRKPNRVARLRREIGRATAGSPAKHAARLEHYNKGSIQWLIGLEEHYGGFHRGVPRHVLSPHEDRTEKDLAKLGMQGGDRMYWHYYAPDYARHLAPFVNRQDRIVICEIGILRGSGLAIWCDLFPNARVIGMDIDLGNFRENEALLKSRGAFTQNAPELYQFDQLSPDLDALLNNVGGDKLDIVIDDAIHSDEAILNTLDAVKPHLADEFVYFAEDNEGVAPKLQATCPTWQVLSRLQMTVMKPKGAPQ